MPFQEDLDELEAHLGLLHTGAGSKRDGKCFPQYGLFGGDMAKMSNILPGSIQGALENDPRIFFNVAVPSSVFICGSQGSGKSHTLSCLLENCLVASDANVLPNPLTGIVFHYDTFVSDSGGSPCEAAYLSSHAGIKDIYGKLSNATVEELRFDEQDLNTKRMLDLMAVSSVQGGGMPLYLHVVTRILRDLRREQQQTHGNFNYTAFKQRLASENMTPGQKVPLQQRLDTLESFMPEHQTSTFAAKPSSLRLGNDWTPKAGHLTIVDLSCPCITPDAACALFNICLSLFIEQDSTIGRAIALDEAHKFMTDTDECMTLTEMLLSTIRLQRHLGARVFISTQEPTLSPKLLDLCTVTVVHRFTSPDWMRSLKSHLAAATSLNPGEKKTGYEDSKADKAHLDHGTSQNDADMELLRKVMNIRTGEALVFAPTAMVATSDKPAINSIKEKTNGSDSLDPNLALKELSAASAKVLENGALGPQVLKVQVRKRITEDGGRSVMAV